MAAQDAPVHNHTNDDEPLPLIGLPAGQDKDSEKFQEQYNIITKCNIDCAACCWHYLTRDRYYGTSVGRDVRVTYGQADKQWTNCYISPKQGIKGKHGQFKAAKDPTLKPVGVPSVKRNTTSQQYFDTDGYTPEPIVIGKVTRIPTHIESIAVPCVTDANIKDSCLSYNNAAILELYRAKKKLQPLQGVCETTLKVDDNAKMMEISDANTQVKQEMK